MTFIVAWKNNGVGYLCADSALTTTTDEPYDLPETSSFGEPTINLYGHQVAERSMKIYNLRRAMVAICGDYNVAHKVVLALRDEIVHVENIRVAFTRAIEETLPDVDSRAKIHLILVAPSVDGAIVLFFNSDNDLRVSELNDDHMVRFGSLDSNRRKLVAEVITQAAKSSDQPKRQLASVLGLLQSLGINNNLLEERVGGVFYGAYVTTNDIVWQGDFLYFVRQPDNYWIRPISMSIRDNAVIVKSEVADRTIVLANTLNVGFDFEQWHAKWHLYVLQKFELNSHDYVVFLTAGLPNCTIVEMLNNATSLHLKMPIFVQSDASGVNHVEMSMSPDLKTAIDDREIDPNTGQTRARVTFFPYETAIT